jgi:AcrR family transcriptional regulator
MSTTDGAPTPTPTPRRRGRPNAVTREQVIDAGVQLANDGGLESLSFRALGHELGVAPTTVQRTIGDIEELYAELVRRSIDEVTARIDWPDEWHGVVRTFAEHLLGLLLRHPLVLESHRRRAPLVSTHSDQIVRMVVDAMRSAGLDDERAVYAFFVVYDFVVGHASVRIGRGDSAAGRPERVELVGQILGEHDYDERCALGVDLVLAGIEQVARRPGPPPTHGPPTTHGPAPTHGPPSFGPPSSGPPSTPGPTLER